jgi:CubicO group peptidase (beta-lactamase class C family)
MKRKWIPPACLVALTVSLLNAESELLPRSTPEAQGISSAAVLSFIDRAEADIDTLHSFMLLRHGHVVAEGWWAPYGPDRPHALHSLSKSFTSTAVGFAVQEGLMDLNDRVIDFFPDQVPEDANDNLRALRVRQLLNMTTGQEESVGFGGHEDWIAAFMTSDFPHKPGTHWVYNSSASFMLSAVVQQVTGQTMLDYLKPRFFDPLGIEDAEWEVNPQGINSGGWGLSVRTRDLAALGQFYLQKGAWRGEQLLSEAWVQEATRKQASNGCEPESDWDQGYGYQFWMCRHGLYRGDGAHGQFCIVFPEQDAVLAITSGTADMGSVMNTVWDTLLPALQSVEPLPEDSVLARKLQTRLSGLTLAVQSGAGASPLMDQVGGKTYRIADNTMGVSMARLEQEGASHVLIYETATGEHRFPAGHGFWLESTSSLSPEGPMPAAASYGWTDETTFVIKGYLVETAYRNAATVRFDGQSIEIEMNSYPGDRPFPVLKGSSAD